MKMNSHPDLNETLETTEIVSSLTPEQYSKKDAVAYGGAG